MRLAAAAVFIAVATPLLAQEPDCPAVLTAAIANEDDATLGRLVKDKEDRELIGYARQSLAEAVGRMEAAKTRLSNLRLLDEVRERGDTQESDTIADMRVFALASYQSALLDASKSQDQLELVVKNACAGTSTTSPAGKVVLEINYKEPAPTEWDWKDVEGGGWTATIGDVTYTMTNGSLIVVRPGLKATYSWTPPPEKITADGFSTKLSVDGESSAGNWNLVTIAQGAWYRYDPDPAQTAVTLNGNNGGNTATVKVLPPAEVKYGFDYKLNIGGAFAAGVDYYYTAPREAP